MVLGGRSLFAVAFHARQPSLWTGVIDRVRGVLVWSRPLCSGSSPRTSGMPVWWHEPGALPETSGRRVTALQ
eukprot:scaffold38726_cov36-Phaeocystis_antarctica.AAC.1